MGECTIACRRGGRCSSDALKLPWRQISGLRDVLIHDYPNLDLERIRLVASRHVPELLRAIDGYLRERAET